MFLWVALAVRVIKCEQEILKTFPLEEDQSFSIQKANETDDEGPSLQEEWVHKAMLDVAYYLRSHKFNEYDRRYETKEKVVKNFYKHFPEPPLRMFHWEVHAECSQGLVPCLRYLAQTIAEAVISRSVDTVQMMYKFNLDLESDADQIAHIDEDCRRLYDHDWENPEPFLGPIQRFQFRTTASYYMCLFTLEGNAELSVFGEPCDNFASCLYHGKEGRTNDPRADDTVAFACAMYSFCPDPCCPLKTIKYIEDCRNTEENECAYENTGSASSCVFNRSSNVDLHSIVKNQWNVSCECQRPGFVYQSMYGMCVDVDECADGLHNCDVDTEHCINLEGSYGCACLGGTWRNPTSQKCETLDVFRTYENTTYYYESNLDEKKKLKKNIVKTYFDNYKQWKLNRTRPAYSPSIGVSMKILPKSISYPLFLEAFPCISAYLLVLLNIL